jgi:hypothetical protein
MTRAPPTDSAAYIRSDYTRRLERLRRRTAASENRATLQEIGEDVSELAFTAPESLLPDIGDLVDRIYDKRERLALAPAKAAAEEGASPPL